MSDKIILTEKEDKTDVRRRKSEKQERSEEEEFSEDQYKSQFYDTCAPPVSSIVRAVILLAIGTILTVVGSLLLVGYFDAIYADRTWPVLTIGLICFIPGFYYSRIAYYAHKGYAGFSYQDIPGSD